MLPNTVVVLLLFAVSSAQNDNCPNLSSCGECIQQPECVWCLNPKDNTINCENQANSLCESKVIANKSSTITKDDPLSSDSPQPYVQIRPQHIKLRIPKNQEHTIEFKFARAQNPLDLYFLMDVSFTMKPYKDLISQLGKDLVEEIQKHTTDFKIGFGSFVDKTIPPFDYLSDQHRGCTDSNCKSGYSFRNHLSLTTNIPEFERKVNETETASNIDRPEGGLEALMQVIVCTENIGWRRNATHLVVLTTDDYFHIAGDGRLGGVVFPNDGRCHMEENEYTKDKEFDYPSVSYLNYKSELYGIHIIFAIAESDNTDLDDSKQVHSVYEELSKNIKLSKYNKLNSNRKDIIDLVVNTYKDILQSVQMSHDFDEKFFEVKFLVKCPGSLEFEEKNNCQNLKVTEEIEFKAIIKPIDCSGSDKQYIIKADGIDEHLQIDLEVICACDCENIVESTESTIQPDETCNNNGFIKCGICSCYPGFDGKYCECSNMMESIDDKTCIDPKTNSICNGNGNCKCGVCNCLDDYYGAFCMCEDVSCPRANGNQLCSGENNGRCKCGECICLPGWKGSDCSCPISNSQCIAPYSDGKPCSEKGECICGKCKCETDYFGDYCEGCKGCKWCEDLDPCVEAYLKELELSEAKSLRINCSSVNIIPRDNATASFYDTDWSKCLLPGKLGCNTVYRYKFDYEEISVEIGEEICPFIASIGGLLLAILLPIILGGIIAFLAWKGIVTVKDKKEYANFLKKKDQEKWNTELNPLYKSAQTTYTNPLFGKSK